MKYLEITIKCSKELSEIISYILMENGADGVNIIDNQDYINLVNNNQLWDYVDNNLVNTYDDFIYLKTCFKENEASLINKIQEELHNIKNYYENSYFELKTNIIEDKNWNKEWKKYYSPLEFNKIVIKPKWIKQKFKDKIVISIDPSMAFGTGQHESTSNCICLMQELDLTNKDILDLGCGSGILGICALKLGANSCEFVDIDENAIKVCKDNCKLNKIKNANFIVSDNIRNFNKKFEVIFANLTVDILKFYAEQISNVIIKNGYIVMSGIIDSRENEIINVFESLKFKIIKHIQKGDWHSYICQKI